MKRLISKISLVAILGLALPVTARSQQTGSPINVEQMTLEQMKNVTQDDLLQLPFEDLIKLVKKFKLSSIDELYALLLNPTQTTASKKAEDLFNSPLSTTVITAQELQQSGARSIPEALRLAPGIIVREKVNGDYDVHIRGNDNVPPGSDLTNSVNSTTLVMINNRPVYNTFLGATFWENLPVEVDDVEKIEIIYGPASALYGPNAVSGVIHIITKQPEANGWHSSANVQAGTRNTQIAHGALSWAGNKLNLGLSGNYQRMDRFQDTYFIPETNSYVAGSQVGDINAGMDTTFQTSSLSTNYNKAKEKGGVNLFVAYQPSSKFRLGYDASWQSSTVQTAYMDIGSVLSTRESQSFSNNLSLQLGNWDANFSGVTGHLNAIQGLPGYEYDYTELNGKIGYNLTYKNLTLRPGVDANYSSYSDKAYVDEAGNGGLLNGTAELGTVQGSVRADYTAFKRLRLVGAWMQGYFYKPERSYSSYQFSASYKSNENTLLRMVVSKANSSPFVLNTYMNKQTTSPSFMGQMDSAMQQRVMIKKGNPDLNPLEMHTIELGLRHKIFSNLQTDVALFYNRTNNFAQMQSDVTTTGMGTVPTMGGAPADSLNFNTTRTTTETMQNIGTEAQQIGLTASLRYVMNEKLNATVFATVQKSWLTDYVVSDSAYLTGLTGSTIDRNTIANSPVSLTLEHTYTPSVYGGGTINYQPFVKWNINASVYGYGKQRTFYQVRNTFQWLEIDPKIIGNLKVSYKVKPWMDVYVNARNIINDRSKEFMFTDDIGGSYLAGMNIKF